ncbi:hypothetical protein D3C87_1221090 [compost metagenome]
MRPKDSQGTLASRSGSCSLIEAVSPAIDATTSHTMAQQMNRNTTGAEDASAASREGSSMPGVRCAEAGSSGCPASPSAKITRAAAGEVSNRPFCMLQIKAASAITESRNAESRMAMVFMALPAGHETSPAQITHGAIWRP